MTHFDLIIIGSGSGNSVITEEMADWRIAIVEEGIFGGTCLNAGCIPTKIFVYAAEVATTIRDAARYGIDARIDAVRWPDIRDRVFSHIDPKSARGREYRAHGGNTTLFEAHAEFVDAHTLQLSDGQQISADRIVVATGSRAIVPELVTRSGVPYLTSDNIMRLPELPRRLAIAGSGPIAVEFAHIFTALGSEVTIVTRGPRLLSPLDDELSRRFTEIAQRQWDVRLNSEPRALTGSGPVSATLPDGSIVEADALLVAIGRRPNSDRLNLAAIGVELDEGQRVVVDAFQRTTVEGIWALGDVCSPDQLKHVANQDARVVAHNLVHPHEPVTSNHHFIPAAVFTHPQVASVGMTQEQALAAGVDYYAAEHAYGDTAYGWALEDTTGFVKLLADRATGQLIGAHVLGPDASMLIQPLIQAMAFGQPVEGLARGQYWIHPALTEVVENALLKLQAAR